MSGGAAPGIIPAEAAAAAADGCGHCCRSGGVLWLQGGAPRSKRTHAVAAMRASIEEDLEHRKLTVHY